MGLLVALEGTRQEGMLLSESLVLQSVQGHMAEENNTENDTDSLQVQRDVHLEEGHW